MHLAVALSTTLLLSTTSATNCSVGWVNKCTRAVSDCCRVGAAQANTTCEVNRQLHYYWMGSAQPYNMLDCDIARLAGISVLIGDTERGLSCTLDDIKEE